MHSSMNIHHATEIRFGPGFHPDTHKIYVKTNDGGDFTITVFGDVQPLPVTISPELAEPQ